MGGGGLRNKLDKVHGGMTFFACQGRGGGWVIFGRQ